jgi:anti-sigma B factor antagonist
MKNVEMQIEMAGPKKDIAIIRVYGFIDSDTSRSVSKFLDDVIKGGHYRIIFDLERTQYISSAGWGIFIGEVRTLRENGGDLKLAGMSPEVEEIFKMLEFFNVLKSFDTGKSAISDYA